MKNNLFIDNNIFNNKSIKNIFTNKKSIFTKEQNLAINYNNNINKPRIVHGHNDLIRLNKEKEMIKFVKQIKNNFRTEIELTKNFKKCNLKPKESNQRNYNLKDVLFNFSNCRNCCQLISKGSSSKYCSLHGKNLKNNINLLPNRLNKI